MQHANPVVWIWTAQLGGKANTAVQIWTVVWIWTAQLGDKANTGVQICTQSSVDSDCTAVWIWSAQLGDKANIAVQICTALLSRSALPG